MGCGGSLPPGRGCHLNAGGVDEGASAVNGEVGGRMTGYGIWDTDMGWHDLRRDDMNWDKKR